MKKSIVVVVFVVLVIGVGALATNFAEYKSMPDLENANMPAFVMEANLPEGTRIDRAQSPEDRTMWRAAYPSCWGPQISYYDTLEQLVAYLGE